MKEINLTGAVRTVVGKKSTRAVREAGLVPCILYGEAKDANNKPVALPFTVSFDQIRKLLYTPEIFLVNLDIDGKAYKAILQDAQFHPVSDAVLHVDFLEVNAEKPIVIGVPIKTEGLAVGVRAGGKLTVSVRKIKVRANYHNVPEKLVIDVTKLNLGKSIKVGELSYEGLELVTPKDVVVCTVKTTRAAQSNAAAAAAAAAAAE